MISQDRREFLQGSLALAGLGVLSGCGILPPQARPAIVPRIGYLDNFSQAASPAADWLAAFRAALGDLGHVEGRTFAVEPRYGDSSPARLAEVATELVRQNVDVVLARAAPAVQAAQRATSTIPIVMAYVSDPVALGFVASLARPGGNITGLTTLAQDLAPKRLQLLKETAPGTSRVGVLYRPGDPGVVLGVREMEGAARTLGVQFQALEILDEDPAPPLAAAIRERIDALVVVGGTPPGGQRQLIVDFAAQQRLPAMYEMREWMAAGGLMGYGVNFADLFRRAATYVDKILKGARPADLPVERPTRFDFIINLKTAGALGLTIPQYVLVQATEVVQ